MANPPFMPPRSRPLPQGNGPIVKAETAIEEELSKLTRTVERTSIDESEHPALAACKKAADMVRNVHKAHAEQGETMAKHLEQIGQTFMDMCKEAADKIREQRILPEEMSNKMADELEHMGKTEAERQTRVKHGLTAARDAIVGIDGGSPRQ